MAKMSMRRMLMRAPAVAGLLAGGIWMVAASPASATGGQPSVYHYAGPAPGSVTCNLSLHLKFGNPFLTITGGGVPATLSVVGSATSCTPTAPGVVITGAHVTGSITAPPIGCSAGPPVSVQPEPVGLSLTIKWRGQYTQMVGSNNYFAHANFNVTTLTMTGATISWDSNSQATLDLTGATVGASSSFDGNGPFDTAPNSGVTTGSVASTLPNANLSWLTTHCVSKVEGGHGTGIHGLVLNTGSITVGPA